MTQHELSAPTRPGFSLDTLRQGDWPLRLGLAVVAVALPTLLIFLAGKDPAAVFREFFTGMTVNRLGGAVGYASILMLCTASAILTFTASLWNIGIEGQLAVGTIAAMAVVLALPTAPAMVVIPLMLLAGAVAGALWAFLVALFKLRGVHEIFSGFALNQVAGAWVKWMLLSVWGVISQRRLSGIPVPDRAQLPEVGPFNLWMLGIALVVLFGVVFVVGRTMTGLRIRAVGLSLDAARTYGISANRIFFMTLLASGAIAGIAGTLTMSSYFRSFQPDITAGFGFTAILLYLIARMNPLAIILISLLFGLINAGTIGMQIRLGIDPSLAGVIQSSIILALFVLQRKTQRT